MGGDEEYPPEEAAQRRDEVIRRMANTPPQPKINRPRKTAKATADRRRDRKAVRREKRGSVS